MPDSCQTIGACAFRDSSLEEIYLGKNLSTINREGVSSTSLKNIEVSADNKNLTCENGALYNRTQTKLIQYEVGNTKRSVFSIPKSVTTLGQGAFSHSVLRGIVIEGDLTCDAYSFDDSTNLEWI